MTYAKDTEVSVERSRAEIPLSWFAGLFEGEGCISIHGGGRRGYTLLSAQVTMIDLTLIEAFFERFGGYRMPVRTRSPRHRQAYVWHVRGASATWFLSQIKPFVVSGRVLEKIALAEEYAQAKESGKRLPGYRERLAAFRPRMRALNARGPA